MPELTLRSLQPEDFEHWLPLWAEYIEQSDPDRVQAKKIHDGLVNPDIQCDGIIAFLGDIGVGLAHSAYYYDVEDTKYVAYLDHLQVMTSYQGQGIGGRLIEACIDQAKERGCSQIHWITRPDNKAAQKLYDRYAISKEWLRYKIKL